MHTNYSAKEDFILIIKKCDLSNIFIIFGLTSARDYAPGCQFWWEWIRMSDPPRSGNG